MGRHILEAFLSGDFVTLTAIAISIATTTAWDSLRQKIKAENPAEHIKNFIKDYYHDFIGPEMVQVEERIKDLEKDIAKFGSDVVSEVAQTVGGGLATGEVPPQTDGHLGETRDIYTPDGDVPVDVGTIPGMSTDAAGTDRSGGGYGSGSGGGGGGTTSPSGGGTTSPTGGSGTSTTPTTTEPPTATDLGLDPNGGDYIEYQPGEGQVSITHADGSVETRPWPP
jgi:hypothetical protein